MIVVIGGIIILALVYLLRGQLALMMDDFSEYREQQAQAQIIAALEDLEAVNRRARWEEDLRAKEARERLLAVQERARMAVTDGSGEHAA